MQFPDLEADVQFWIEGMRENLEREPGRIPVVGDYPTESANWDDLFGELCDSWSPQLRQRLLSAFSNQVRGDDIDLPLRYTSLQIYNGLANYVLNVTDDPNLEVAEWEFESLSSQVASDLRSLVDSIRPENMRDWRTIVWEITNAYLVENWDRAFQLYERAAHLSVARETDLLLMRGHLQFLMAFDKYPLSHLEDSLQSTCYIRKRSKLLHPFNWEPKIYDSQDLPLSLLLLASGLNTAPAAEAMAEVEENLLQEAIKKVQLAQRKVDLEPPYRAILARCYFRLGAIREAMAEYERLLDATTQSPWSSLKPHVYRSLSACHVQVGDLTKAIKTLHACTDEFPRETNVYFERAKLQARNTDFAGAAETVQKAAEAVPEIDSDWRLSTVLALRSISDSPEPMLRDREIQKLHESHPEVWHLIQRTCAAYWPVFNRLGDVARERWIVAILQAYYFGAQEKIARLVLEETAIKLFAMAVQIELRSRVFDVFKEEVCKSPKLKNSARLGSASPGDARIFGRYLMGHAYVNLGTMATIIRLSEASRDGILAAFRTWLLRWRPKVTDQLGSLNIIAEDRNLATHEG